MCDSIYVVALSNWNGTTRLWHVPHVRGCKAPVGSLLSGYSTRARVCVTPSTWPRLVIGTGQRRWVHVRHVTHFVAETLCGSLGSLSFIKSAARARVLGLYSLGSRHHACAFEPANSEGWYLSGRAATTRHHAANGTSCFTASVLPSTKYEQGDATARIAARLGLE